MGKLFTYLLYGDSSHASRTARERVKSGEPATRLERVATNSEDRQANRKAKRKAKRGGRLFYWE